MQVARARRSADRHRVTALEHRLMVLIGGALLALAVVWLLLPSDARGVEAPAAGARSATAPAITLVRLSPATVTGRNFRPRSPVVLRLVNGATSTVTVRATRSGGFTHTFSGIALDRCGGWSITAAQRHEPTARISPARAECAPGGPTGGSAGAPS